MKQQPRRTPRIPRTVLYDMIVPVVLVILVVLLVAVVVAVFLWPAPGAG